MKNMAVALYIAIISGTIMASQRSSPQYKHADMDTKTIIKVGFDHPDVLQFKLESLLEATLEEITYEDDDNQRLLAILSFSLIYDQIWKSTWNALNRIASIKAFLEFQTNLELQIKSHIGYQTVGPSIEKAWHKLQNSSVELQGVKTTLTKHVNFYWHDEYWNQELEDLLVAKATKYIRTYMSRFTNFDLPEEHRYKIQETIVVNCLRIYQYLAIEYLLEDAYTALAVFLQEPIVEDGLKSFKLERQSLNFETPLLENFLFPFEKLTEAQKASPENRIELG